MAVSNQLKHEIVALTRDLVLIPSSDSRPTERERCFQFVKNHVDAVDHVEIREVRENDIPSLLVLPRDIAEPEVLMCAHLDVIDHADDAVYRSRVADGRIYGPGSGDMKGALAVFLELFRHVQAKAGPVSLGMLVTSDEETGGSAGVRHVFQDLGLRCGTALIPDGGSLTNITVEEKGVVELRMTAHGHGTHAARPWLSDNALKRVLAAAEDVSAALNPAEDTEDHWHTTCTLTMVDTRNRTPNRIAGEAGATLDVRFPAPLTSGEILARVRNIVPGDVAVEIGLLAEPACLSPDPLFLEVANELTGNQVNLVREHGASDARFAVACGIPVVMSRPDVGNLHAEDEWIDIESMMAFFTMYATYLERKLA